MLLDFIILRLHLFHRDTGVHGRLDDKDHRWKVTEKFCALVGIELYNLLDFACIPSVFQTIPFIERSQKIETGMDTSFLEKEILNQRSPIVCVGKHVNYRTDMRSPGLNEIARSNIWVYSDPSAERIPSYLSASRVKLNPRVLGIPFSKQATWLIYQKGQRFALRWAIAGSKELGLARMFGKHDIRLRLKFILLNAVIDWHRSKVIWDYFIAFVLKTKLVPYSHHGYHPA